MNFRCIWILLFIVVSGTAGIVPDSTAADPPRMLMVTQSMGYRHQSVNREGKDLATAEVAMIQLGQQSGEFTIDCTQDATSDLTRENLQNYDIVTFYTTGKLPVADEDLQYFLGDWLHQKGHGFIGFHSATDTLSDYEPYWDMVGGNFSGHPWGSKSTVHVTVHDTEHPGVKPFGTTFEHRDEIYQYKDWQPEKVRVLMSLDMAKTELKRPYHVPVAWCKQVGEGKMFYNNFGHREDTWQNEVFLKSVVGAVRWIAGKDEGDATPNPEVSMQQHQLAFEDSAKAGVTLLTIEAERIVREAGRVTKEAERITKAAEEITKETSKPAEKEAAG